jgi:hypothetical protein
VFFFYPSTRALQQSARVCIEESRRGSSFGLQTRMWSLVRQHVHLLVLLPLLPLTSSCRGPAIILVCGATGIGRAWQTGRSLSFEVKRAALVRAHTHTHLPFGMAHSPCWPQSPTSARGREGSAGRPCLLLLCSCTRHSFCNARVSRPCACLRPAVYLEGGSRFSLGTAFCSGSSVSPSVGSVLASSLGGYRGWWVHGIGRGHGA